MELTQAQLKLLQKKRREAQEQQYLEDCKNRLEKIATTKMKTSFIGAIDAFEKTFGFLWGHESGGPTTEEEEAMYELWMKARTEILDNGHTQLRGLITEITNHIVYWKKYHMDLPVIVK